MKNIKYNCKDKCEFTNISVLRKCQFLPLKMLLNNKCDSVHPLRILQTIKVSKIKYFQAIIFFLDLNIKIKFV